MGRLLAVLPWGAAVPAAIDTWLVRRALAHRPLEPRLFLETWVLWFAFALLALVPALLTAPLLARLARVRAEAEENRFGPRVAALAFWMLAPVLAHQRLDDYTAIGGDISGLKQARPWIEVAVVLGLLALVGIVLARLAARWSTTRASLVLGVPALLAGLFLPGGFGESARDRRPPSAEGRPNLLLLVWDTTRAQSLSPYGYERATTPHLAAFAQQSLVFEEARSVSCFTLTSHLSMLTGVYPSHHGARLTRMSYDPRKTPSIARLLRDAGYRTGAFVGTDVLRASTGMHDGFEVYSDRVDPLVTDTRGWALVHDVQAILAARVPTLANDGHPHWFQDFQRPAEEVLAEARAWIERDDPRPWLCFVNLYDAHWPYLPDAEERARWVRPYDGTIDGYLFRSDAYHRPPGVKRGSRLEEKDRSHLRELYDAELAELDAKVGAFLDGLDLESGRVGAVLTSDHGEGFGEGGRYEHDDILEPQVRVPLLVRLPRTAGESAPAGVRSLRATGVDVAATLLGMAGQKKPAHLSGGDLARLPDGVSREVIVEDRDKLAMQDCRFSLYDAHWKLVVTGVDENARVELHDLDADPVGLVDVGDAHPEVREKMRARLAEIRASWGGDRERWGDAETVGSRGLSGLGYTGGGEDE